MKKHLCILLALAGMLLPLQAHAADARALTSISDSSVNFASAETLTTAKETRRYLFIQNIGTTYIWVNYGGTAAANTAGSLRLAPYDSLTFEGDTVVRSSVSVISETSAGKITAYEG